MPPSLFNNNKNIYMTNNKKLQSIVEYVSEKTGIDILMMSRGRQIVYARALYCKIALKATNASLTNIGDVIGKNHATIIHARNNIFHLIESDVFYMNIYKEFFGEKISEQSEFLTDNEKKYRELSNKDKEIYNDRAALVLKSFDWKRRDEERKEVFEIINVGM